MNNWIRFYNQNRLKIWGIVLAIVAAIVLVRVLNGLAKAKHERESQESNGIPKEIVQSLQDNYAYSVMSQGQVGTKQAEENENVIESFINFCNKRDVQSAYDLLSTDCKEAVYPNLETFVNQYYYDVFNTEKTYSMQSWYTDNGMYTYKMRILDDMLSTGNYNTSEVIEDYYTIVKEDGKDKLNINNYMGKQEINQTSKIENITFDIQYKQKYADYEVYYLKVTNNRQENIAIDSKESSKSIFLTGKNNTTYSSYLHELDISSLAVNAGEEKEIIIKFNKVYNPERKIQYMNITDIILNYDEYQAQSTKKDYTNRTSIKINL